MVVKAMQAAIDVWDNPVSMIENWENSYDKRRMEDIVATVVGSVGSVADLGCGSGRYAVRVECKQYYGFDSSAAMLKHTSDKNLDHVKFFLRDVFTEPSPATYDVVLLIDVLQHMIDPVEAIKFILRSWNAKRYIFTVLVGEEAEVLLNSTVVHQTVFDRELRKKSKILSIHEIPLKGEKFCSILYEVERK